MNKIKKIAFMKTGSFSHTNISVHKVLQKEFPDFEIEIIDLWENELVSFKSLKNVFFAWQEYGFRMFYSKKNILKSLINNSYIFNLVKLNINELYSKEDFVFTFQTQSQFDMSINGIQHFIYTDHTAKASYLYPDFNIKKEFYSRKWLDCEKSIYSNASITFTMSDDITHSIIEEYGCDSSKVVCAYVAPNANIPDVIKIDEGKYLKPNILFVGKEWEAKGGDILVKAFIKVFKDYPEAKLTIVGCSPDIDIPNCNVMGRVPVEQVGDYFSEATIFCLPTRREAFGIVFLEAMAYSLPVIGSNIGAIPQFIIENKNGFVCDVEDVDQFAKRIQELIESPDKSKNYGKFGNNLYLKHYTWDNVGSIMKKNINKSL